MRRWLLIVVNDVLNAQAALDALKSAHPSLQFIDPIDISNIQSNEPVEILPNIFLCLSYRFGMFKADQMLASLKERFVPQGEQFQVVSQWQGDRTKAK